jgi:hypothetical protein
MNYIKRLEKDRTKAYLVIAAMDAELTELRRYLTSAKFHEDTTVQVADVLRRLDNVTFAATDAAYAEEK